MWTLSWTGNIPLAFTAPCTAWNQTRWFTYKGIEITSLGKNRFSLCWAVSLARNHFWQCSCNNGWNYLQRNFTPLFSVVPVSLFWGWRLGSRVSPCNLQIQPHLLVNCTWCLSFFFHPCAVRIIAVLTFLKSWSVRHPVVTASTGELTGGTRWVPSCTLQG